MIVLLVLALAVVLVMTIYEHEPRGAWQTYTLTDTEWARLEKHLGSKR